MKSILNSRHSFIALLLLVFMVNGLEAQRARFKSDGKATGEKGDKLLSVINSFEKEGCSVLEVSKEMFEILAQDERASEEGREILKQIDHLIYLNCIGARNRKDKDSMNMNLTEEFKDAAGDNDFTLLMRSQSTVANSLFYKRTQGDINEYILVTNTTIQYISTKLSIMSIRDLREIVQELASTAGGL